MKNKWFPILLVVVLTVSVLAACTPRQRTVPQPSPENQNDMTPQNNTQITPNDNSRIADTIANEVERIEGVERATVVVNNNTAYVAVDLDNDIKGARTDAVKEEVVNRVRNIDLSATRVGAYRTITKVYVTSDMDTYTRLQDYARDIRQGKPISGMIDEIQEMFRRSAPESD